jgi:ligand-binding sensor domain-containing protein
MGAKQGLPHDSVYAFAQDRRGFLWIATFGGLSRYDGYRLHNYFHDAANPLSLSDNNIRLLLPAADGGLWIATGNVEVISYDPSTDSFHPLPNLPVIVESAWYETTWFLLLKIVAAFAVLFLAVRLRTAVIRKRQMELETEAASRTAELAKKQAELVMTNERLAELATRDPLTAFSTGDNFLPWRKKR